MIGTNVKSDNEVYVSGILNELNIEEGKTVDGRAWIRGEADIRVDQEINGQAVECIVPIKMFSMRLKNDGTANKLYDSILKYKTSLTSAAAAENISDASKITVNAGNLEENVWIDKSTGTERSGFQITGNFLNAKKNGEPDGATFKLSGVVLSFRDEIDRNDNETGRTIIKFGIINYRGDIQVLDLYASGSAKAHIEQNWEEGETVKVTGRINMIRKTETIEEEQGFGDPITRTRTVSKRELIVTGGSAGGLEEEISYDADSIKAALSARKARIEALKEAKPVDKTPKKTIDYGF